MADWADDLLTFVVTTEFQCYLIEWNKLSPFRYFTISTGNATSVFFVFICTDKEYSYQIDFN